MPTVKDKLPEETLEDVDEAEMESKRDKTKSVESEALSETGALRATEYGSHISDDG